MADEKYLKFTVNIPKGYSKEERTAIAQEIVDYVVDRTKSGKDKNGNSFPGYSKEYIKSLDFKNAGKSKGNIDLTLSGDMLAVMRYLENKSKATKLSIGYSPSDPEAGRVEGNVRGSYGKPTGSKAKARNFLGITKTELDSILSRYPLDDDAAREKSTEEVLQSSVKFQADED